MSINSPTTDTRTPSPPHGYSKPCMYSEMEQVHIVAEFHCHKIQPGRIAYRTGIDIDFIRQLLAGESHNRLFKSLLERYRGRRRQQKLKNSHIVQPRFRGRKRVLEIE